MPTLDHSSQEDPSTMATLAQWIDGARPRTLPAAIAPVLAGTGHTAFSTMPVIVEVAKEGKVRPSRPLSAAVIAAQMAIVAGAADA